MAPDTEIDDLGESGDHDPSKPALAPAFTPTYATTIIPGYAPWGRMQEHGRLANGKPAASLDTVTIALSHYAVSQVPQ